MVNSPAIISLDRIPPDQGASLAGERAAVLGSLASAGFPVPSGFVVTTASWRACIEADETVEEISRLFDGLADLDEDTFRERAQKIREAIVSCVIPEPLLDAIRKAYIHLTSREEFPSVALRSSVAIEGETGPVPRGLFNTYTSVQKFDNVIEALRGVWAGAFTDRALRHLIRAGLLHRPWRMAAIIQGMAPADVTGTLFSCDPATGESGHIVIHGIKGAAPEPSSKSARAEVFLVNRNDWQLDERRLGGTQPCGLSEDMACALARFGRRVEEHFGSLVEIDWCARGGKFFLLDAKPYSQQGAGLGEIAWSRVGLAELIYGPMTPFTRSFIAPLFEDAIRKAMSAVGITVSDNARFYADIYGRLYADSDLLRDRLKGWTPIYTDIAPEACPNINEEETYSAQLLTDCIRLWIRGRRHSQTLAAKITETLPHMDSASDRSARSDLRGKSDAALHLLFDEILTSMKAALALMQEVKLVSILAHSTLRNFIQLCGIDNARSVHAQLLEGSGDASLAADVWKLARLAESIEGIPDKLKEISSWEQIESYLARVEGGELFTRRLNKFISRHGRRCAGLFEISRHRWQENPLELAGLLTVMIDAGESQNPVSRKEIAAARARESGRNLKRHAGLINRFFLQTSLRRAVQADNFRTGVQERLIRMFDHVRALALETGRRFTDRGEIASRDDVFLLTIDEIKKVLALEILPEIMGDLVEERREEFDNLSDIKRVPLLTYRREERPEGQGLSADEQLFEGLGVAGGTYTGAAKVFTDPSDMRSMRVGDAVVVPEADEAFAPIVATSGALALQTGGFLSSVATLSRRFGVPCVTAVENVCNLIRTGDILTVDGSEGIISVKTSPEHNKQRKQADNS